VVPMTQKLVNEFASLPRGPHERPLSRDHLNFLEKELSPPKKDFDWAMMKIMINGVETWLRENGQHTVHLFVTGRLAVDPSYMVHLSKYEGDTLEDASLLWQSFDCPEEKRTRTQIVHALASSHPRLTGVDLASVKPALSGVEYVNGGKYKNNLYETIDRNIDFILFSDQVAQSCKNTAGTIDSHKMTRVKTRQAVQGAIMLTWMANPGKALAFWSCVLGGVGALGSTMEDPALVCRHMLESTTIHCGAGKIVRGSVSTDQMVNLCIVCWNSFRRGRTMKHLKPGNDGQRPKVHS